MPLPVHHSATHDRYTPLRPLHKLPDAATAIAAAAADPRPCRGCYSDGWHGSDGDGRRSLWLPLVTLEPRVQASGAAVKTKQVRNQALSGHASRPAWCHLWQRRHSPRWSLALRVTSRYAALPGVSPMGRRVMLGGGPCWRVLAPCRACWASSMLGQVSCRGEEKRRGAHSWSPGRGGSPWTPPSSPPSKSRPASASRAARWWAA